MGQETVETETVERYVYRNTSSHAGKGERVSVVIDDIQFIRKWVNSYGNPSYTYTMKNGDLLYLVDDYGAMNGLGRLSAHYVGRKKDLFS